MSSPPRSWQQRSAIVVAVLLSAGLSLAPLLWPLAAMLGPDAGKLWAGLEVFTSSRPWLLLVRSVGLASAVTAVALTIGVPLGLWLGRFAVRGRQWVLALLALPILSPPFLLALGWFYLFGRYGFLGNDWTARLLFSELGHVAILSLTFSPVATFLVAMGLWNLDASLEEAARLVARPGRVALQILLPGVWPSIMFGSLVVFALSLSELGVPMFLRVEVYPTAVFARLGGIDYNPLEAFLLALPLLPVAVALLGAERWLFRDRPFDVLGLRYQDRPPIPWRRWGWLASGLVYLVAALIILPIASLFARAAYGGGFAEAPGWIGASLFNSVFCSFVASSLIIGLAIILGHASARRLKGSNCGELITVQAFVVPAVLLGVGLIAIWNRPATGFLYTGFGILILGYMARYAVIGVRTAAMVVAQSPPSLEQAAAVFGGGYGRRLWEIVLPLHRRGLLAAWLLTMLFCLRDLEMAVLYYPPGLEPLTVRIFTLEANGPEPVVAALATIQMLISALMLVVGTLLIKRKPDS